MFIKVLIIHEDDFNTGEIKSMEIYACNREFNFLQINDDSNLNNVLSTFNPHIILTFVDDKYKSDDPMEFQHYIPAKRFPNLYNARMEENRRWLTLPIEMEPTEMAEEIMRMFLKVSLLKPQMLFSIITTIYMTPIFKLKRLYDSLLSQTHTNWEWVVVDDSPEDYITSFIYMHELSKKDHRIQLFRKNKHSGIIGEIKKYAFSLASGDILVEVDHDDELINTCLDNLCRSYNYSGDIGFVYGYVCEQYENSTDIVDYGPHWAFGYGAYMDNTYKDKYYKTAVAPNINSKTIRHIVGAPNHVRSWKKDVYNVMGGHNKYIHVADDYELLVRTFLYTQMAKMPALSYIQYFEKDSSNSQFIRNGEIQRLVNYFGNFYNNSIHDRFLQLGIDDFCWRPTGNYDLMMPNPETEQIANYIIPPEILV
jgi:glycosyltransferase involved in cell wall biosynthesis